MSISKNEGGIAHHRGKGSHHRVLQHGVSRSSHTKWTLIESAGLIAVVLVPMGKRPTANRISVSFDSSESRHACKQEGDNLHLLKGTEKVRMEAEMSLMEHWVMVVWLQLLAESRRRVQSASAPLDLLYNSSID